MNFSFPGVSRGGSWAESSGTFHGISAPGAVENLWKRTFLLGKNISGTSWDFKGISGNPERLFPLFFPKKNADFGCFEGAENSFLFHYRGNLLPVPRQKSMFKAAPITVCIPGVWELKAKWEL